ncbi:GNAT family N-acetyltransferase [Aquihabitans sp. G128]|uniref:GNAT family N-acetyltransferase n=1 Tax=Aquihabitans sp. G128 TaxID=2849779 RepID=UPI001C217DE0|nr:GNAT family N-acetyltransferase [Aquihabitans sp. G128]QXC60580.1 GNAT family N-acetyltransferase [Aquihabitans sp. G128]
MTVAVVRTLRPEDWAAVRQIYADGIETGNATFETEPPDWEAFDTDHSPTLRLVADLDGAVVGWAAARLVSDRCVYAGVAEHSVYVASDARSHGIGRLLLEALIVRSEGEGIWTMQSGVFPENTASLQFHVACGFEVVGIRRQVGRHHGRWRDVIWIERRSTTVGV